MKKIIALLFCLLSCFGLFACADEPVEKEMNQFVSLENDATLVVGGNKFINLTDTNTKEKTLTYLLKRKYTLNRSFSLYNIQGTEYVEYEGAYYYWTLENAFEDEILGIETTVVTTTYSYLTFGQEKENIIVKEMVETTKTYNYTGGERIKEIDVEFSLNGYFDSMDHVEEVCPALLQLIDSSDTVKYYVDTTIPTTKTIEYEQYTDTYYYFE